MSQVIYSTLWLTVHVEDRGPSCVLDQDPSQRHGYHRTSVGSWTRQNIMTEQNLIRAANSESGGVPVFGDKHVQALFGEQYFVILNLHEGKMMSNMYVTLTSRVTVWGRFCTTEGDGCQTTSLQRRGPFAPDPVAGWISHSLHGDETLQPQCEQHEDRSHSLSVWLISITFL